MRVSRKDDDTFAHEALAIIRYLSQLAPTSVRTHGEQVTALFAKGLLEAPATPAVINFLNSADMVHEEAAVADLLNHWENVGVGRLTWKSLEHGGWLDSACEPFVARFGIGLHTLVFPELHTGTAKYDPTIQLLRERVIQLGHARGLIVERFAGLVPVNPDLDSLLHLRQQVMETSENSGLTRLLVETKHQVCTLLVLAYFGAY